MSDRLIEKFKWLRLKQDQKMKNFGMVGMGYVVEYHNEAVAEITQLKEALRDMSEALECVTEHESGCIGAYKGREDKCRCVVRDAKETLSKHQYLIKSINQRGEK